MRQICVWALVHRAVQPDHPSQTDDLAGLSRELNHAA